MNLSEIRQKIETLEETNEFVEGQIREALKESHGKETEEISDMREILEHQTKEIKRYRSQMPFIKA